MRHEGGANSLAPNWLGSRGGSAYRRAVWVLNSDGVLDWTG
jgi:hypothetical protein